MHRCMIHKLIMTMEEKTAELEKIAREIREFKELEIAREATNAVPGEGSPDSEIMFIGEGPGYNEDLQGRPFVGQAGKLLEKTLIDELGLRRDQVYITNIIKYRPPENRDPSPDEIEACRDWLDRQIAVIGPRIIVTLGRFCLAKFIPEVSISRVHGQPRFVDFGGRRYIVVPMYHPAAALRSPTVLAQFLQDFAKLKRLLGQPLPQKAEEALGQQALF